MHTLAEQFQFNKTPHARYQLHKSLSNRYLPRVRVLLSKHEDSTCITRHVALLKPNYYCSLINKSFWYGGSGGSSFLVRCQQNRVHLERSSPNTCGEFCAMSDKLVSVSVTFILCARCIMRKLLAVHRTNKESEQGGSLCVTPAMCVTAWCILCGHG